MRILFVCTGNICRSPMAEMMLKQKAPHMEVASAGIMAYDGGFMSEYSRKALSNHGVICDEAFRSSHLKISHLETYDLILTMTYQHKHYILNQYPGYNDKVWVLPEYVDGASKDEVADPYGYDYAAYEAVYQQLNELLEKLIEKLDQ